MDETGKQIEFKISLWDYVRYFPVALPFMKDDLKEWWKGLGNDW